MKEKSRSTEIKIVVDAKDNNVDCVATVNVGSIDLDTTIELLQICIDELTKRKWKENIEMILQTNDHVTFIKSIIRNASEEGRCVNEIESEEIANSLKAMLQECDDLENCMVTANQKTIKYESLIMKLNELMNCISEYPWVLDTAIDGIGELIVKVNQKAHL